MMFDITTLDLILEKDADGEPLYRIELEVSQNVETAKAANGIFGGH